MSGSDEKSPITENENDSSSQPASPGGGHVPVEDIEHDKNAPAHSASHIDESKSPTNVAKNKEPLSDSSDADNVVSQSSVDGAESANEQSSGDDAESAEGKSSGAEAEKTEGKSSGDDAEKTEGKSSGDDAEKTKGKSSGDYTEKTEGKSSGDDAEKTEGKSSGDEAESAKEQSSGDDAEKTKGNSSVDDAEGSREKSAAANDETAERVSSTGESVTAEVQPAAEASESVEGTSDTDQELPAVSDDLNNDEIQPSVEHLDREESDISDGRDAVKKKKWLMDGLTEAIPHVDDNPVSMPSSADVPEAIETKLTVRTVVPADNADDDSTDRASSQMDSSSDSQDATTTAAETTTEQAVDKSREAAALEKFRRISRTTENRILIQPKQPVNEQDREAAVRLKQMQTGSHKIPDLKSSQESTVQETENVQGAARRGQPNKRNPVLEAIIGNQNVVVGVTVAALVLSVSLTIFHQKGFDKSIFDIHTTMQQRLYQTALKKVDTLLVAEPNNPVHHLTRGKILSGLQNEPEALKEFIVANKLDPKNLDIKNNLARSYATTGNYSEAVALYNELLPIPRFALDYNFANRGFSQLSLGNFNAAVEDFNRAIALSPSNLSYYRSRANCYQKLKKYKLALQDWNHLIALDPSDADAYAECGNVEYQGKLLKPALRDLSTSILLNPTANAYYWRGFVNRDEKRIDEALSDFEHAVKLSPKSPEMIQELLQTYASDGKSARALRHLDDLMALNHDDSTATLMQHGMLSMNAFRYKDAVNDFNKVLDREPGRFDALARHAICAEKLGDHEGAYSDYCKLIEQKPDNARFYLQRAHISSEQKHDQVADADFDKAISLNRNYVDAYMQRGNHNAERERFDEALSDFNQVLRIQPRNLAAKAKLHAIAQLKNSKTIAITKDLTPSNVMPVKVGTTNEQGYARMKAGDLEGAIKTYTKVLKKNPNDTYARRYLAHCLLEQKQFIGASSQFKQLQLLNALTPDDESKYVEALISSGAKSQAVEILEKNLSTQTTNLNQRIKVIRLYMDLGWKQKALACCRQGLYASASLQDTTTLKKMIQVIQTGTGAVKQNEKPSTQVDIGG